MANFRIAATLALATLAVIATLCVLDENSMSPVEAVAVSKDKSEDDFIGNDLLEQQAQKLEDAAAAKRKGKGMNAIDDMLKGFQEQKDDGSFAKALADSAPKKDSLEASISPERLGFVPPTPSLQLVQDTEDEEWEPQGQEGMSDAISSLKGDEEKEKLKADGLEGSSILSAVGMGDQDTREENLSMFVQVSSSADDDWEPQGQTGLADDIASRKGDDEKEQLKADGLEGSSVLSAVGMATDGDDDDTGLNAEDLMLLQVQDEAEWVPQGQGGLSTQIAAAEEDQEAAEVKADGLEGTSMLSAVGIAEDNEEELLQQEEEDDKQDWHPKGQAIKKTESYDDVQKQHEKSSMYSKLDMYDGLDPDRSILGAIGLGHHMKPSDETEELGKINPDDIDLDLD